ncbi:SDR family oxidoreductase [Saccharospirillum salsuginis]|uniref:3-oxoacyl-ACP reductase n=1 Tax=Saccharospirillum salsuginis TaxID=418750 RepID=A0A918NKA6_9GAMM|nr:SDR family oxidoreductase [Saccharospirillum salsuginis]GGX74323.1 3-oxoacyl-ACP reductase [Saccharospirillum salsuginis]
MTTRVSPTALITGAGRGIGAATARHLAGQGYRLCLNFRQRSEPAEALCRELTELGSEVLLVQADVSLEADVERLFREVDDRFGGLTALVNNVGIVQTQMRVEDMSAERLNRMFTTNVTSAFLCCREAVRRMSTRHGGPGGAIVNVSSAAARLGSPNEYVDYAASKAAMDALTRGLAIEVAEEGIRVNTVRPGIIDTEIHADGGEPDRIRRVEKGVPMKRGGRPEEVTASIAWLLSDDAGYVSGAFLDVAGGR